MAVDLTAELLALSPDYLYNGHPGGDGAAEGSEPCIQVYVEDNSTATFTSVQPVLSVPGAGDYTWTEHDVGDAIYVGNIEEFDTLNFGLVNSPSQLAASALTTWEFWNGTIWTALVGITDGTVSFKAGGGGAGTLKQVDWTTIQTGWTARDLNNFGVDLFYVRARVSSGTYTSDVIISTCEQQGATLWGLPNLGTAGPPNTFRYRQITTSMGTLVYATTRATVINTDSYSGAAIQFEDDPVPNEARMYFGPLNYQDDFGLSFGFFYRMGYRGHNADTATGTFPDQLGFTTGFKWQYKGTVGDREIEFSVVEEQNNTDELGPYLQLKLFDNNEASPDNRGLSSGEVFTMTDPVTGGPWRWEYRDEQPLVTAAPDYQYEKNDRTMRLYFIGFSLIKSFLADGTEFWKCAFYANGRYSVENAAVAEVPHEILNQSTQEQGYLFNYYDDGTAGPDLTRSTPHYVQYPFIFKKALSQANWDTIYELAAKQTYGTTGYFDVVTSPGPPVRGMGHESILFGSQLRDLHHTHELFGNARFVPPVITKRFRLTITGAPDSEPDVQLPMKSFSVAKSLAEGQTVSFQIPYRDELMLALSDRPNGIITLEVSQLDSDGVPVGFTQYLTAVQADTVISEGALKATISLNGSFTVIAPVELSYTVIRKEIERERIEGGVHELVIKFNEAILPGDTINWTNPEGAQSFVVRTVQLNATPDGSCVMILQEDSGSG